MNRKHCITGHGGVQLYVHDLGPEAVVRNPNVPYFIRFNTLQALLVDIIVVIISYAFIILPIGGGLMMRTLSSTVVVGVLAVVIFALIECSRGREPDLPGLSQAVRMQLY